MLSSTGSEAAEALISRAARAGNRLSPDRLADPTVAARIGSVAGADHPNIELLSAIAVETSVEDDYHRGLRMLLDGIAARRRTRRHR
jgi:hypothetical protein